MPTVVALTDASVPSLPRGWNAVVRIFEADGTTPATVYADANGDNTGANPLPQAKGSEFGIAGTGSWTVYVTAGTYVLSVTPHGGSAHTQTVVVATPAVPEAGTELGTVWGTPSDGQVPLWNATAGRFEWGDAGGSASSSAVPAVPDGVTITDADNTYSGTGTYKVTNTPDGEDVFLAVGEAGDSFPRLVMLTDGSLFFGDGTADPLAAGTGLVTFQGGRLQLGIPSDATTAPTVAHDDTVTGFGAPTVKAALDYIATNYGAELAAHEARITALETP